MILPEDDLTLQHEPLKIGLIVWGVRPVADAVFQKSPSSLSLENVSVPGPAPATIFSDDSEEGGLFLDLPSEAGKQPPPPARPRLPFPSAGSGALAPWARHCPGFQVSSEQFQS